MANRAVKRNIQTLQNELALIQGQVSIKGPFGGVGSSIQVNGLTGSLPTLLSGSSPNQFASQFTVQRVQSGSYLLLMKDVWPKLLSVQLTPGVASGSTDVKWGVMQAIDAPARWDLTGSAGSQAQAGFNQLGFILVNSGSTLADPLAGETVVVNVALALANSTV